MDHWGEGKKGYNKYLYVDHKNTIHNLLCTLWEWKNFFLVNVMCSFKKYSRKKKSLITYTGQKKWWDFVDILFELIYLKNFTSIKMGLKNDIFCGINPKEIESRTVYYLKKM